MLCSAFFFFILFLSYQVDGNQTNSSSINNTCTFKYGRHSLKEGGQISIRSKLYKVEECQLQRAYQACGANLWFMIDIVCEAIELNEETKILRRNVRRFTQQKLLTEACCFTACTIAEMSRYCPSK